MLLKLIELSYSPSKIQPKIGVDKAAGTGVIKSVHGIRHNEGRSYQPTQETVWDAMHKKRF